MPPRHTIGVPVINLRHNILDPQVRQALDQLTQETTRWLQRIAEAVDTTAGFRGEPAFHANVNAKDNRLMRVGVPTEETDAQLKGLALGRAAFNVESWDAKGRPIINLPKEISPQNSTASLSQGQIRSLIKEMLRDALDTLSTTATFTITGTGFAVNPTGTARYVLIEDFVLLFLPELTGTSNAATFTLTGLPAVITPTRTSNHVVVLTDGQGGATDAYGLLRLTASSSTITMISPTTSDGSWTTTGTKTLYATSIPYSLV